jgi:hypothetical protein
LNDVFFGPPPHAENTLCADQTAIEGHLLDGLIPAMYGSDRRTRERAERWLRFLARHLDRAGASDLEWWELRRAVPRYLSGVVCGLLTGRAL